MIDPNKRWSDDKLQAFYDEFHDHTKSEEEEHGQQKELYEAVFRKEDKEIGTPPGLLQLTAQINAQLKEMKIWQDRQKTFVGGVIFAISAVWFVLTDVGHKIFVLFQKL